MQSHRTHHLDPTQAPTIRLGDPLPNQDEEDNDYSEFDQSESGPSSTRNLPPSTDDDRGVVEYDDEDEDDEESMLIRQEGDDLPVSHEIVMKDHTKVVHPVHLFRFVTGTDPRSPNMTDCIRFIGRSIWNSSGVRVI